MNEPIGVKDELRTLDPYEFEKFVAAIWEDRGYTTELKSQSRDAGVDVIATENDPYPRKVVIQVKRNDEGNRVNSEQVQRYHALRPQENADEVVIVTTSDFTSPAKDRSNDLNVKLVNIDQLLYIIDQNDAWDTVDSYLGTNISDSDIKPETHNPTSVETSDSFETKEMETSQALIYLLQGGLALLILGFVAYLIITVVL